jgi:hypothetical protein
MSKSIQSQPSLLITLFFMLLLSLFWLAACGTGPDSFFQLTSTVAATSSRAGNTTTSVPEETSTATPSIASGFDCADVNQIPTAECAALVTLYNSTHGINWIENRGWLVTNTPCTWSGIECTGGHISYISLGYNKLTGILPPELGNLSHLRVLGLLSNRLYGPIPKEFSNLSELVALEMSVNQLTDSIPSELGDLPKLQSLSLGDNKLSGSIPAGLGNIASLQSLILSHNQLSGAIPSELGNLVNLRILYLSHNKLSGAIPTELGNLKKLDGLDLSYNQLSGPTPKFVNQISECSLWGNQLDGTITTNGRVPFTVDYLGVHFSADQSLATSIWPEVKPATPLPEVQEGPSYWLALPEHIRFTFADPGLSPSRGRMGFSLAAEAQILVFPLVELIDTNPLVQTQFEILRNLLVERGTVPAGELPLLPLTNSAQVFHAQVQYLDSGNIQGLRFISQYSQDPHPIMLSQEIFYTFQGITDNGAYYVAAFFPLTTDFLPDNNDIDDWDTFHANYDTYLLKMTAGLDQLLPIEFNPDLTLLDAVVTSLRLELTGSLNSESIPSSNPF